MVLPLQPQLRAIASQLLPRVHAIGVPLQRLQARRFVLPDVSSCVCSAWPSVVGAGPHVPGARPQVSQNGPRHLHRRARRPPHLFCTDTALRGRALDRRFRRTGLDTSTEGRAHHGSTALHRYGSATTTPRTCARPQVPQNGPRHLNRGARTTPRHRPDRRRDPPPNSRPLHSSSAQIRRCDHDSADVR